MLERGRPKLDDNGKPLKDATGKIIYEPYNIKVFNTVDFGKSMKDGGKQGRQTFYFDRNRRNELRNAAKQAGQKPQEKQNSKDAPIVE